MCVFSLRRQKFQEKIKVSRKMTSRIEKHPQVGIRRRFGRVNHSADGHCRLCVDVKCGMSERED